MPDSDGIKIKGYQRVNIVRWHSEACPDGSGKTRKGWKGSLAAELGRKPSWMTKWCKVPEQGNPTIPPRETTEAFEQLPDSRFLELLGFNPALIAASFHGDSSNHLNRFAKIARLDDYVDLCQALGAETKPRYRAQAEARSSERRKRDAHDERAWRTDENAYWMQSAESSKNQDRAPMAPMHVREIEEIETVFNRMILGDLDGATTVVSALPYNGLSYALQRILPDQQLFKNYYRGGIHHLHVGALRHPRSIRRRVAEAILGANSVSEKDLISGESERNIANHLKAFHQLLIIHGASAIPTASRSFIEKLSDNLAAKSGENSKDTNPSVSRLLLTVWEDGDFKHLNHRTVRRAHFEPNIERSKAEEFFTLALEHYRAIRGSEQVDGSKLGPRAENSVVKWIGHHYSSRVMPYSEFPASIRFRAFCASDVKNPSPFDPTQGVWRRTDETMRKKIPEISDCFTDLRSDLRTYHPNFPHHVLSLRLVSTSIFFFSSAMLQRLIGHDHAGMHLKDDAFSHDVEKRALPFSNEIRLSKYLSNLEPVRLSDLYVERVVSPLLVRSLVQDDWMEGVHSEQPTTSRRDIHEALGDTLRGMAASESAALTEPSLSHELLYSWPWGDGRVVFALEAIRHYARAIESAVEMGATDVADAISRKALAVYDDFLEQGTFSKALGRLEDRPSGRISRERGLHSLKYEALCLLSSDGMGKSPPRSLDIESKVAFFREIGITLTRMLRPIEACHAFDVAMSISAISASAKSYLMAHAIRAYLMLGDIRHAKKLLDESKSLETLILDESDFQRAKQRNIAREAEIYLADRDIFRSRETWGTIVENRLVPFSGDRAISYFDTMLSQEQELVKDSSKVDELWSAIERSLRLAQEEGLENERLQIEVRRAKLARLLGHPRVAEAILDHVGLDLVKHSGAEVLFREFQIESAETLRSMCRPKYAFVAYAWPAFQSLRRRAARPLIGSVVRICQNLLSQISAGLHEHPPNLSENKFWNEIRRLDENSLYPFFSVDLLPSEAEIIRFFNGFEDSKSVDRHQELLHDVEMWLEAGLGSQ